MTVGGLGTRSGQTWLTAAVIAAPIAVLLAIALGGPLRAGVATAANATPPAIQPTNGFCANVPASADPFVDDNGSTFEAEIECLAESGVTAGGPGGLPANQYGPGLVVTRAQMASFIAREIDTANAIQAGDGVAELAPYDGRNAFSDVSDDNVHVAAINRLARAGITAGGPGGRPAHEFGPGLPVTRAQMASFINRGHELLTGAALATTADYFTDDGGDTHEANINGIASEGIAVGDGIATYRPSAHVTRGQMAAFLIRHLAVLEEAGLITALPGESYSPFTDSTEGPVPELQEPDSGPEPGDGTEAGAEGTISGTGEVVGEELTEERDPCALVPSADFAAWIGAPSASQQVLETGVACGYTGGDDVLRLAVGLLEAEPEVRWLPDDVVAEPLQVQGYPAQWVSGYPVPESSVLVVALEGHDLVLEVSSRERAHADAHLREGAISFAETAISRYQP